MASPGRRPASPRPGGSRRPTADFLRERLVEARRAYLAPGSARRALCEALGVRAMGQTATLLAEGEARAERARARRGGRRRGTSRRSRSPRRNRSEGRRRSYLRSASDSDLGRETQVMRRASRSQGALSLSLLVQMLKQVGDHTSANLEQLAVEAQGTAMAYVTLVLVPQMGSRLPLRAERELRTLAEAIDGIVAGRVQVTLDLLSQRFRAVKASCTEEGGWSVARHLEVLPNSRTSTVPAAMRASMAQEERDDQRLRRQLRPEPDCGRERIDPGIPRPEGKATGKGTWDLRSAVGGGAGPARKGKEKGGAKNQGGKGRW